ncbi:carbohydrate kinase [Coriobacteriales bacterium OH1046]|nr:carbohydrate kinase [Coriobacteriales bacterium OH1046]
MAEKVLLGLDNGGSETKCAVYALDGRELAVSRKRLPIEVPHPGWSERDAEKVWNANVEAVREALSRAHVSGCDVVGVGLTGYGNGACLVDAAGQAVCKVIVSTDERANGICAEFADRGIERKIYPFTCQSTWAAQPAALLPWLKRNSPELLERARWWLGIKDYVRLRLTGEVSTEITEASSTCLLNLHTREFDEKIFEALGIPELFRLMPPVRESTEVAGHVSAEAAQLCGLLEGTPVAAGYFDIDAAEFASGVVNDRTLCLITGTWSINERLAMSANTDYDRNKNTVTLGYRPGYFNVEESWPTSASNFDWYIREVICQGSSEVDREELYARCNSMVSSLDPRDSDVIFVPYLYGSSYPSDARGCFLNLSSYTTHEHMLLAVYEGVCLSTLWNVRQLVGESLPEFQIRISGGVTRSRAWTQIMADVLQAPMQMLENHELSAHGAAMCAGVASGVYDSLDDAIARSVRLGEKIHPRAELAECYREKYERYVQALEALAVLGR